MSNIKRRDDAYEQARRQENTAHNEMDYYERQAARQRMQLDGLFKYKDECVNGLKMAKENGLTPVHIREFQLLMTHINSSIETVAYKVDVSQDKYEEAKEVWQNKNEHFETIKESIKQKVIEEDSADIIASDNTKKTEHYDNDGITMVEKSKRV